MRKLVASLFMSVDGVVGDPAGWQLPYFDEEMGREIGAAMAKADAMLLGRATYEEWAAFFPSPASEGVPSRDYMNEVRKFVVSNSLKGPLEWNNSTLIEGDLEDEIAELKAKEGGDIGISGSGTLVRSLLRSDLLDELNILLHPVVVGAGKRLFEGGEERKALDLVDSKTFSTGVVFLTYRPAAAE
jgi:dihydrofolate reductase